MSVRSTIHNWWPIAAFLSFVLVLQVVFANGIVANGKHASDHLQSAEVVFPVAFFLAVIYWAARERDYRSEPLPPVKRYKQVVAEANQAVAEVVDYYIAGLPPEWTLVERKEDVGYMGVGSTRRQSSDWPTRPTASASRCMQTCGTPPWS